MTVITSNALSDSFSSVQHWDLFQALVKANMQEKILAMCSLDLSMQVNLPNTKNCGKKLASQCTSEVLYKSIRQAAEVPQVAENGESPTSVMF